MASITPKAREAIELAKKGEVAKAISSGEAAIADSPDDAGLHLFIGMLYTRQLDLRSALPHLRQATELIPNDPLPRLELARALIGVDQLDDAEAVIRETRTDGPHAVELGRVRGLLLQRRGRHSEAAILYRRAIAHDYHDFESWGHLGMCLLADGDAGGAVEAMTKALELRPDQPVIRAKLAEAQAAAGLAEQSLKAARASARALPYDPLVRVTIGRLEDLLGRPEAAMAALEEALALDPRCAPALLALADLLERDNRLDLLEALMRRIDAAGIAPAQSALLRARLLYRQGRHEAALAAANSAPEALDTGSRAQLIGQISDRLGDYPTAFAAFAEMNRLTAAETAGTQRMAEAFRSMIAGLAHTTTRTWFEGWTAASPSPGRPPPTFLVGFPRSGTTLLDTALMGHPGTLVLEERPILQSVADRIGSTERLADLDQTAVDALRAHYFDELDAIAPEAHGRHVIDKLPFGIVDAALIHRIFPDARFIFVERHPCDVALSCYMTRFDPRAGMANFLDLGDTARLYDLVMDYWRQCREVFPLAVHTVRYERMIGDAEAELRPLAAFLQLDWDPRLLDHCRTARQRSFIGTPSYGQVSEPLYTRANGRWQHYREQMKAVLPVLAPWAARMGYEV